MDVLVVPPGDGSGTEIVFLNSDIIAPEPVFSLPGVLIAETDMLYDVDPQYVSPGDCGARANFRYANSALSTAGVSRQAIGSQGHISPVMDYILR